MLGIKERLIGIIVAIGLGVAGYHGVSWWLKVYSISRSFLTQTVIDFSNMVIAMSMVMLILMVLIFVVVYEGCY